MVVLFGRLGSPLDDFQLCFYDLSMHPRSILLGQIHIGPLRQSEPKLRRHVGHVQHRGRIYFGVVLVARAGRVGSPPDPDPKIWTRLRLLDWRFVRSPVRLGEGGMLTGRAAPS